ncbi:aldehyde dehydrogenase family protein [Streptomyces sp. NPDC055607]
MTTTLHATDPRTGEPLDARHPAWTESDLTAALTASVDARAALATCPPVQMASLLRGISAGLGARAAEITRRMDAETALGAARCDTELARTRTQAEAFAAVIEDGGHRDAVIDTSGPQDLRRLLQPLGTVAVFGAGNFPLAFGVAGGDVVSALAARCPVVVKGHPAHPGTSELVAAVVDRAVADSGLPEGTFASMVGGSLELSRRLVADDRVDAVGFTGSYAGGTALAEIAARRPRPVPVFAEMGSVNPVVVTPEACAADLPARAELLAASVLTGWGQFCTRPGVVFVPSEDAGRFGAQVTDALRRTPPQPMLAHNLVRHLDDQMDEVRRLPGVRVAEGRKQGGTGLYFPATVVSTSASTFLSEPVLREEFFGPVVCLVAVGSAEELLACWQATGGNLTGTVHAVSPRDEWVRTLWPLVQRTVGRIVFNGVPTGVAVSPAQHHGGPYPATNHPGFTSVGTAAVRRFMRPVAYQDVPDDLLPPELRDGNPLDVTRTVNGVDTREALPASGRKEGGR